MSQTNEKRSSYNYAKKYSFAWITYPNTTIKLMNKNRAIENMEENGATQYTWRRDVKGVLTVKNITPHIC